MQIRAGNKVKICVILRMENPSLRHTAYQTNVTLGFYSVPSEDTIVGARRELMKFLQNTTPIAFIPHCAA